MAGGDGSTHKQQQTLVLPHGPAAAQEAQQEKQAPHGQEDVDARDEQGVGSHNLSEASGVHHDPDADAQQTGPTQLLAGWEGGRERNRRTKLGIRYSTHPFPSEALWRRRALASRAGTPFAAGAGVPAGHLLHIFHVI